MPFPTIPVQQQISGTGIGTVIAIRGPVHGKQTKDNPRGTMRLMFDIEPDNAQDSRVTLSLKFPWDIDNAPLYNAEGEAIRYSQADIQKHTMPISQISEAFKRQTLWGALLVFEAVDKDSTGAVIGITWEKCIGARCKFEMGTEGQAGFVKRVFADSEVWSTPRPQKAAVRDIASGAGETPGVTRQPATATRQTPTAARADQRQARAAASKPAAPTGMPTSLVKFKSEWFNHLITNGMPQTTLSGFIKKAGAQKFDMLPIDKAVGVLQDVLELVNTEYTPPESMLLPLPAESVKWGADGEAFGAYYQTVVNGTAGGNEDDADLNLSEDEPESGDDL